MSELIIDGSGKVPQAQVKGAYFMYTQIQNHTKKYKDDTDEDFIPNYETQMVTDKATAKAFKAAFSKNEYKKYANAEFKERFKCDAPFPEQDEQYVIRVKQPAYRGEDGKAANKFGEKVPYDDYKRPKVYLACAGGLVSDITMDKLVGNGSFGDAAFYVTSFKTRKFPRLRGILVNDLVEYGTKVADTPFGDLLETPVTAPPKEHPPEPEEDDQPF